MPHMTKGCMYDVSSQILAHSKMTNYGKETIVYELWILLPDVPLSYCVKKGLLSPMLLFMDVPTKASAANIL